MVSASLSAWAEDALRPFTWSPEVVRIQGRVAVPEEGGRLLEYPGVEIEVRFRGRELRLEGVGVSGENWFNVTLDGAERPILGLPRGPFEVILAEGLDPETPHLLRMVRRNEAWQGRVRLDRFEVEDGGFLPPPPLPSRKLMVIGDSITCGQGVDWIPPDAIEGNHNANAEGTYGWLLAKIFGTQIQFVSYGGKGLIRDWEGKTDVVRAPQFFERTSPDAPDSSWDHDRYHPDLVIVMLGTNDFSRGVLPVDTYASAYVSFIERIRAVHPETKVLLVSSPIFEGEPDEDGSPGKGAVLEACLRETVKRLEAQGADYVAMAIVGHYPGTEWDAHPIAPQHRRIAADLMGPIEQLTGWESLNR